MGITLIFPGQGSQYVGMGKNLMDDPVCQSIFNKADETLNYSISELCLNGPEEGLKLTENTQPAIVAHSIALFSKLENILRQRNIQIDRVLGHSVGEYSALVAAKSIRFEDAIKAVHMRGKFMQDAVPVGVGKMYALLKVPESKVKEACEESSDLNYKVMPANFNEPGQIVISGHARACDKAVEWLKENFEGRHMAIPLQVSAPFHSTLMGPAEEKLNSFLSDISFQKNEIPYIANVNAFEYPVGTEGHTIKNNLVEQVCGSVLWHQSLAKLSDDTIYIEAGPGKVLTGLNKKINNNFKTYCLDGEKGFEGLGEFFDACYL